MKILAIKCPRGRAGHMGGAVRFRRCGAKIKNFARKSAGWKRGGFSMQKSGAQWETLSLAQNGGFRAILRAGGCGQNGLYTYLMTTTASVDPILKRFSAALDETYGNRLDRVVLFGAIRRIARNG
jgi:hypothetical protein